MSEVPVPLVIHKIQVALEEQNIECKTMRYTSKQCSCCFYPEFKDDNGFNVTIPVNIAENEGGYIEPYEQEWVEDIEYEEDEDGEEIEYDNGYYEDVGNPHWNELSNENFDHDGNCINDVYINYTGGDKVGQAVYDILKETTSYNVEWQGSSDSCVIIRKG